MPGMGIFETEDEEDDAGDQTWSSDITTVVTWHFQIALYRGGKLQSTLPLRNFIRKNSRSSSRRQEVKKMKEVRLRC